MDTARLSEIVKKINGQVMCASELLERINEPFEEIDFSLENVALESYNGENFSESNVDGSNLIRAVAGTENPLSGEGIYVFKYEIIPVKKGKTTVLEYFERTLRPLLENYNPESNHIDIQKFIAYMDFVSQRQFSISMDCIPEWIELKKKMNEPSCLCDVTNAKNVITSPEIKKVQTWAPCYNAVSATRCGGFFDLDKVARALTGHRDFKATGYKLVVDYEPKPVPLEKRN